MTPTFAQAFGLDLVWGAERRAAAYYRGLYDAIDGERCAPRSDAHNIEYLRGYGDGLAQLATYRPVVPAEPSTDDCQWCGAPPPKQDAHWLVGIDQEGGRCPACGAEVPA